VARLSDTVSVFFGGVGYIKWYKKNVLDKVSTRRWLLHLLVNYEIPLPRLKRHSLAVMTQLSNWPRNILNGYHSKIPTVAHMEIIQHHGRPIYDGKSKTSLMLLFKGWNLVIILCC